MNDRLTVNKTDNNIEKIVIKYDDGTEKEINKGVIITDDVNGDDHKLTFEFANVTGEEVADIVYGVTDMGIQIGLFGKEEGDEE